MSKKNALQFYTARHGRYHNPKTQKLVIPVRAIFPEALEKLWKT